MTRTAIRWQAVEIGGWPVAVLTSGGGATMPLVSVGGRRFFYDEQGSGEPLVFLSGLGGDNRAFSVTTRHFSQTQRALALDARDSGRRDRRAHV